MFGVIIMIIIIIIIIIKIMIKLAAPALFCGRLRAFGKCTNGVALLGRPDLARFG